jgi:N-acetylneuraminate synthase
MNERILALVTARGGSKGFPGKNLAPLAGRPLVAWTHRVLHSLQADHPELLLRLSTDDQAIADAWPRDDRPTELRPAHLAEDTTTSLEVVRYELEAAAAAGQPCSAVLLVQPTSPLLSRDDLAAAVAAWRGGARSVVGVAETEHPMGWACRIRDGVLESFPEMPATSRRQETEASHLPVGFWLASTGFISEHQALMVPGESVPVLISSDRAVDIDRASDLDLAALRLSHSKRPSPFVIADRPVGPGQPCFIIAEAGVNHNGSVELAEQLIDAAAEAGADAVKFQTFRAEALATAAAPKAAYQTRSTGDGAQVDMLKRLELPVSQWAVLKRRCEDRGLVFLSSPFDSDSARLLDGLQVQAIKLGSGEITNRPLLEEVAAFGRPLILSSGMSDLDEVEDAIQLVRRHCPVAMLHCVSSYPAPAEQTNLRAMASIAAACGVVTGLSDHSDGAEIPIAGIALGAALLEKHLTLDRNLPGPDHAASLEPAAFAEMVAQIRRVESALGDGIKRPVAAEMDTRAVARKSLVLSQDRLAGHRLQADDLTAKRPGTGLSPMLLDRILGRKLRADLSQDHLLCWEDLTEP